MSYFKNTFKIILLIAISIANCSAHAGGDAVPVILYNFQQDTHNPLNYTMQVSYNSRLFADKDKSCPYITVKGGYKLKNRWNIKIDAKNHINKPCSI